MIVHAKEDDGGQPTGNAGDRIAAGVIGISKDAMAKPGMEKKGKAMKKDKMEKEKMKKEEAEDVPEAKAE